MYQYTYLFLHINRNSCSSWNYSQCSVIIIAEEDSEILVHEILCEHVCTVAVKIVDITIKGCDSLAFGDRCYTCNWYNSKYEEDKHQEIKNTLRGCLYILYNTFNHFKFWNQKGKNNIVLCILKYPF